jgi:hypothetical protein
LFYISGFYGLKLKHRVILVGLLTEAKASGFYGLKLKHQVTLVGLLTEVKASGSPGSE